jgi:sterol desaturase/sphingolipid hydroxylase (fatty acid hydroxylase superfamily)
MNFLLFVAVFPSSYVVLYRFCKGHFVPFRFSAKYPDKILVMKETRRCVSSVFICSVYDAIVSHLNSKHRLPYQQQQYSAYVSSAAPTIGQFAIVVAFILIWSDTHFYWTHRLLHDVPWLYRHIHKVHHESYNPDPMSGLSFHPVEAMLYFTSIFLVCLLPIPYWAYRLHASAILLSPANGHNGHKQGELDITGVQHHYIHHTKFAYNFGSPTPFWDYLCGTEYRESDMTSNRAKAAAVQASEAGDKASPPE